MVGRTPRQDDQQEAVNTEVEQCFIGSIMRDSRVANQAFALVPTESFFDKRSQIVYDAMKDVMQKQGKPLDFVTLGIHLRDSGLIYKCGGWGFVCDCFEMVPSEANWPVYGEIVMNNHRLREIRKLGQDLQSPEAKERLGEIQKRFVALHEARFISPTRHIKDVLGDLMKEIDEREAHGAKVFFKTGFDGLDRGLEMERGEMVILAGRPSSGKSSFMTNILLNQTRSYRALLFTLEVRQLRICANILGQHCGVTPRKIGRAKLDAEEYVKVIEGASTIHELHLWVDSTAGITCDQIEARVAGLNAQERLDVVVVDYVQIVGGQGRKSRYEHVTEVSGRLKAIGLKYGVLMLAVAQVGRQAGDFGVPSMADLKESGALEQDADAILFIVRESADAPKRKIIVAKQKDGICFATDMEFEGKYLRYREAEDVPGTWENKL